MLDGMEKINLVNNVAPMRNVMLLGALIRQVQGRDEGESGMACFYGFSGYGKSQAALYNTNATKACWVEVKSVWSRKTLVEKICKGLRIPPGRTVNDSVEAIGKELEATRRPLLIDEAHILCTDSMMRLVHDLYESSNANPAPEDGLPGTAIILIGEERLPQQLRKYERIHNRQLDWKAAQPADLREVQVLARLKCPGLTIADEVLQHTLVISQAVARRIVSNLAKAKEYARVEGKSEIQASDIPHIEWMDGQAPAPRRIMG